MRLCFNSDPFTAEKRGKKKICHVPLRNDDAAFPPLDTSPHPAALLEVLGARVDRVQGRRLSFAPVGYETPFHRMHD